MGEPEMSQFRSTKSPRLAAFLIVSFIALSVVFGVWYTKVPPRAHDTDFALDVARWFDTHSPIVQEGQHLEELAMDTKEITEVPLTAVEAELIAAEAAYHRASRIRNLQGWAAD